MEVDDDGYLVGYLIVDGQTPSQRELKQLADGTGHVHVLEMPPGETSLDFLRPASEHIKKLIVTDWACQDARAIETFANLEDLRIIKTDPIYDVDFSELGKLTGYAGPASAHYASALELTTLTEIALDNPSNSDLEAIRSSPREAGFVSAKRVTGLPDRDEWNLVERLDVHLARSFDIGTLVRSTQLTSLDFTAIGDLRNMEKLADLQKLEYLLMEQCPRADQIDALADLPALKVDIRGPKVPIDSTYIERHFGTLPSTWSVPVDYIPR